MTRTSACWWVGILTVVMVAGCGAGGAEGDDDDNTPEFAIADPQLEQCVRDWLSVGDRELTEDDVAGIVHLECQDRQITSLDGIQYFHQLRTLSLWENQISDLTPLAGVPTMEQLQLGDNLISDISPLKGLLGLSWLGLANNQVADLAPLADLFRLRFLGLDHNQLTDVQAEQLCALPKLTWLTIEHNRIATPSLLDCLTVARVYADYQDTGRHAEPPLDPLRESLVPAPRPAAIEDGYLGVAGDADGPVRLTYVTDDRTYPVIPEYAGTVRRDGDRLWLDRAGSSVAIGAVNGDRVELCGGADAASCSAAVGKKGPWDGSRIAGADDAEPVFSLAIELGRGAATRREEVPYGAVDDELLQYALASPNQWDAGSCLLMATTGAAEVLLNQHADPEAVDYKGDTDLSERYLMNAFDYYVPDSEIGWWLTDTLYTYNYFGGSLLDRDYPFVGRKEGTGKTCTDNWDDDLPDNWESLLAPMPPLERTIVFADPDRDDESQWRVALMDDNTVRMIKYQLRTKRAPVVVVYNHYLYWHTVVIVGYDDTADSDGCPFVEGSLDYYADQGHSDYVSEIQAHMDALGGCSDQGVFYVRDSIYDGSSDLPMYDYGGFSLRYSKRIITRSYNWVRYLANHAYSVHRM